MAETRSLVVLVGWEKAVLEIVEKGGESFAEDRRYLDLVGLAEGCTEGRDWEGWEAEMDVSCNKSAVSCTEIPLLDNG